MFRAAGRASVLVCLLTAALMATAPTLHADRKNPMRILLIVDSSSAISSMINHFRAGLNAFLDAIPEDAEVVLVSTGGQLRQRVPATADRAKLHAAANGFAPDGGANSLVDTLVEADRRFLQPAGNRWPVVMILSADTAENRSEVSIDAYNKFMNSFIQRGGLAEAVVVKGQQTGVVTDIALNLTANSGGHYEGIAASTGVAARLKQSAERIASEYQAFSSR